MKSLRLAAGRSDRHHEVVFQDGMQQSPSFSAEPFIERLRLIAAESATRLAIVYPRPVTYGELLTGATRIARGLRARGIAAGSPVPVWIGCPVDSLTASLGIALAGGAFVPIDPRAPLGRARFVVEDCQSRVAIVDGDRRALLFGEGAVQALTTDELTSAGGLPPGDGPAAAAITAEQPACVIYTSGSTGQPKGVVLTHANLANMLGLRRGLHGAASRVLPIHPCSFDAFQGAALWSLSSGGALALLEGEQILDPEAIVEVIERHGITTISAVPSMYQALLRLTDPGRLASLHTAILGGEVMTPELASLHFSQLRGAALFNEYGPTECSVFSTAYRVPEFPPTPIPIGKPVGDVRCQVVAADGTSCGPYEEGELYIGGAGVARGYWHQEALTAERFVTLPALANGTRLYRTGDRVRWNQRGELEFLGRVDDQIKLRGNRIEPAEIERAIGTLPGVLSAAVVLHDGQTAAHGQGGQEGVEEGGEEGSQEGDKSGPRLVAFYVTEGGAPLVEPRRRLADQLPSYMMPSVFSRLDAMPTLSNGKVDRRALGRLPLGPETPGSTAAPELTGVEHQVAAIWARVLGVPVASIGRDADFFGLGGHSLLVTAVRGLLSRELGRTAPEEVFFARSRLGELAQALLPVVAADESTATSSAPASVLPLAPLQETFYYLAQIEPDSAAYVVPATLKLSGPLDRSRLRAAALAVVRENELLRARVERRGDEPMLVIAPPDDEAAWFRWEERTVAAGESPAALVEAFEVAPIAIGGPALARFQLLRASDDEHYLTLTAHHIVVDGASVGLIVSELLAHYQAPAGRPRLKAPYAAFVAASRARLAGERLERLHAFWRDHLRGAGAPPIPPDYVPGEGTASRRASAPTSVIRPLPAALASAVHACARAERVTPFVTALGAVGVTLGRWLPDRDLVVGSPVSLRGLGPFDATIGCMVNSVAIKLPLGSGQQPFAALLSAVRTSVLESMRHAELPIAWLHSGRGRARGDAAVPLFRIFFNYLDRGADHLRAGELRLEPLFARRPIPKFDLTVYLHDWGQRMDLELVYPPERYDERTMTALAAQIEEVLAQVTRTPELALDEIRLERHAETPAPPATPAGETATIHAAFAAIAAVRAADPAVTDERGGLTYRELAGRAGQVAVALEAAGLRPGSRVAIVGSRDTWFVACVIGALEAGCTFAVLDLGAPAAVRQAVLDAFQPDLIVDPHDRLEGVGATRQSGTATYARAGRAPRPLANLSARGDAYVLFTSGTSSRKKGILGTHRPVVRFLDWQARAFGLGEQDRFALLAGLGHDPMLRDLFAPLSVGASLYIPTQETRDDPRLLAAFLNRNRVSVLHITPPLAANLIAAGEKLPSVRLIFCGGDRLSPEQAQRLFDVAPNARLVNGYGLTETPQIILSHEVERGVPLASIPVGVPIPGARIDVERRGGRPCAIGELGEIVVYGDHVAKGVLTGEGVSPLADEHGFHSGDLARRDAWGRIHCLGRRDRERKLRGFRVALDEVEEALCAVAGVMRARAVVRVEGGSSRLFAFVVADRSRTSEARLRTALAARVQAAAVPDQVIILEALPLSPNGKVDDVALAQWDVSGGPSGRAPALEARTQTEDLIIRVWQEILAMPGVGIADNFFDLGGDSIRAVAALSRLSGELGTPLAVEMLMRNPTPAALASALLSQSRHLEEPLVIKVNESGSRPPLWMFHPIGGHVLFIRRLGAQLGPDQPIFGVQARGLDGVQPPLDSMADLVALYSGLVRQHQSHGPYFLGGPSFGGRIAFEVAQQLRQAGEPIAMIAMFDSYAPGFPVLAPHQRLWTKLERHRRRWPWLFPDRPLAAVRDWLGARRAAEGQEAEGGPDYLDDLDPGRGTLERNVREVIAANQRAAKSRPTAYYPGRVTLFRAEIQPLEDFKADFSDVRNGWAQYAREVTVDIVKGTHQRIMDFPALTQLVALFKARLDECRASRGGFQ